jgi:hypothetical protein
MKHSLIGRLNGITEGSPEALEVVDTVNTYNPIWRFVPSYYVDGLDGTTSMGFEIWLEDEQSKIDCLEDMKLLVDKFTGDVSYHICTHDEVSPKPCVIIENYRGVE